MREATSINTYNELRDHAAAVGMMFFGLRYGRVRAERQQYLDIGLSICDVITKGPTLSEGGLTSYDDLAVVEAFRAIENNTRGRSGDLKDLQEDAVDVRTVLKRLQVGDRVSLEEMEKSAAFFRKIYAAT